MSATLLGKDLLLSGKSSFQEGGNLLALDLLLHDALNAEESLVGGAAQFRVTSKLVEVLAVLKGWGQAGNALFILNLGCRTTSLYFLQRRKLRGWGRVDG